MCQGLEEKIRQKSAALQELRDKVDGGRCSFVSQTDKCIQACVALTQQVNDAGENVDVKCFMGGKGK